MKTFPYLSCRKGIFHFRRVVPLDLRNILLKREILVSLRMSDVKAARKIAVEMADSLDSLFRSIRSGKRLLSMAVPTKHNLIKGFSFKLLTFLSFVSLLVIYFGEIFALIMVY